MSRFRIARFNGIPNASWFLARKARELTEHYGILPSEMLFLAAAGGGVRTISAHLVKQKLPFRTIQNVAEDVAVICQISDTARIAPPRKCCFVLLSTPLADRLEHLCRYLQEPAVMQTYISTCLDALEDVDTLSFHLDAECSEILDSLEPGTVYFRKNGERWFCEWPDRPLWTVPHLLVKICQFLATHQHGFLENGVAEIIPLKMFDVATEIGCHLTSVSRVISGVEAQTNWGRFPLKNFFSVAIPSNSGALSQVQVKTRILEIIRGENNAQPLPDEAIANILKSDGISISRRAVTKYRLSLDIPSTRERRTK